MPAYCRSGLASARGEQTDARVTASQLAMGLIDAQQLRESKQTHDNVFIFVPRFHTFFEATMQRAEMSYLGIQLHYISLTAFFFFPNAIFNLREVFWLLTQGKSDYVQRNKQRQGVTSVFIYWT